MANHPQVFPIEKGVPVIPRGKQTRTKFPFGEMVVGDSFKADFDSLWHMSNFQTAAYVFGTKNGMKFSTRQIEKLPSGKCSARCWRVA